MLYRVFSKRQLVVRDVLTFNNVNLQYEACPIFFKLLSDPFMLLSLDRCGFCERSSARATLWRRDKSLICFLFDQTQHCQTFHDSVTWCCVGISNITIYSESGQYVSASPLSPLAPIPPFFFFCCCCLPRRGRLHRRSCFCLIVSAAPSLHCREHLLTPGFN